MTVLKLRGAINNIRYIEIKLRISYFNIKYYCDEKSRIEIIEIRRYFRYIK